MIKTRRELSDSDMMDTEYGSRTRSRNQVRFGQCAHLMVHSVTNLPSTVDDRSILPLRDRAPSPEDEIDFRPRRPRSPMLAVVCLLLTGLLLWKIAPDLGYAVSSTSPVTLATATDFHRDQYSSAAGLPDWQNALYLYPRGEKDRCYFFRLLSGQPLWIAAVDRRDDLRQAFTGRLLHIADLPYAEDLFLSTLKQRQFFPWHPGSAAPTQDRSGHPLELRAQQEMVVQLGFDDELVARLAREKFPTVEDARHELEVLGLSLPKTLPAEPEHFVFVVAAPEKERTAILGKLTARRIAFAPHQEERRGPLGALTLPLAEAKAVRGAYVERALSFAKDDWVLVEDEAPRDYLWAPILAIFLCGFIVFNGWYLLRLRRG